MDAGSRASGGTGAAPRSGGTGAAAGGATGGTAAKPPSPPPDLRWAGPWAIPWPLVACESGGDYGALNPLSGAGGAYQVLPSTWRLYGGRGLPHTAPASEQDRIASLIWADSGPAAWECAWDGRYLGFGLAGALGSLPDPLPPAKRLDAEFLGSLTRIARAHDDVGWALLLAIVRARGARGPAPASAAELRRLARRIAALGARSPAVLARNLLDRRRDVLRAIALVHYNRAVGWRGLTRGLKAVAGRLERRVLASKRLQIYAGGRADVRAGKVDVRVLTLLLYLARRYDSVTVSSLISGHSFFTSAGRPSNHAFGQAVDVTALNERSILGSQQPGGATERALRRILLMPRELRAEELISLFDLGGPSFAAPDHADHIHVGF
ncbi:MAG: hypothetical protein FVQ78_08790 [Solirubrobacterales bacterium]|nr:hypothetical protein [Solirubrobacterales bacterium]